MIQFDVQKGVARIILNRPDKLNALTLAMREQLRDLFHDVRFDRSVRSVLLTAEGRGFCAGADVAEFDGNDTRLDFDKITNPLILNLNSIGKPIVCAVNGLAVGFGWSLALASDLVIAGQSARFSQVFRRVGLIPDGGAVWFLSRIVGPLRAKELVYSARMINATEAHGMGLVTEVVPDAELRSRGLAIAEDLAAGPPLAFGYIRKLFELAQDPTLAEFLESEANFQCRLTESEDHKNAVRAFVEKREPTFTGR